MTWRLLADDALATELTEHAFNAGFSAGRRSVGGKQNALDILRELKTAFAAYVLPDRIIIAIDKHVARQRGRIEQTSLKGLAVKIQVGTKAWRTGDAVDALISLVGAMPLSDGFGIDQCEIFGEALLAATEIAREAERVALRADSLDGRAL